MDAEKRKRLEEAGWVFGDFADFLGMNDVERQEIEFRADLAVAICRLREHLKLTRPAFCKRVGLARPELARLEIAAPEVSLDLMLKVYFTAGGRLRYQFEWPDEKPPASPPSRRKAAKAVKA